MIPYCVAPAAVPGLSIGLGGLLAVRFCVALGKLGVEHVDVVDDVAADVGHHLHKQVVAFQLVLHQGVTLRIATEPDRL